jgi:hypothetical protein
MTEADRVYITPPTNTSARHSRRSILGAIAGSAAAAGSIAGLTPAIAAALPADPIFVAIEKHTAAGYIWDDAVTAHSSFLDRHMTDEQARQYATLGKALEAARDALNDTGVDLINTAPTTLAGIARALNYIREQMLQENGVYMPSGLALKDDDCPEIEIIAWIDAFLDTIEYAARELDRAGKAVQS